jgi:hypothetical protein
LIGHRANEALKNADVMEKLNPASNWFYKLARSYIASGGKIAYEKPQLGQEYMQAGALLIELLGKGIPGEEALEVVRRQYASLPAVESGMESPTTTAPIAPTAPTPTEPEGELGMGEVDWESVE